MTIPSTYTLWKHNDREAKLTYSITLRPGWTPDMLSDSRLHYIAACQAARDSNRLVALKYRTFNGERVTYDAPCTHDEPRVQIFGDVAVQVAPGINRQVTINCFTETQSGQQLLDELWAIVDTLQMIEAVAVLEQAQAPQPATLRPSRQRVDVVKMNEPDEEEMIYRNADVEGTYENHDLIRTFGDLD
jgi:hypothetical protein